MNSINVRRVREKARKFSFCLTFLEFIVSCTYNFPEGIILIRRTPFIGTLFLSLLLILGAFSHADVVTLHDGTRIEGVVLSFQNDILRIRTIEGEIRELGKKLIERIEFEGVEEKFPVKKLKVELKNIATDDYLDIFVNSQKVIKRERESGEWKDVTSLLKDGANDVRVHVHNDRDFWSYKWAVRINGRVFIQQCGEPNRPLGHCQRFGLTGKELGVIENIPALWLYVDFRQGTCEIAE